MRNVFIFLLIVLLAGACGRKAAIDPDGNTVTIKYWRHKYPVEDQAVKKLIAEFENQNPDIRIDYKAYPYKEYRKKLDTALTAATGPDVINIHDSWVYPFVKAERILALPPAALPSEDMEADCIPLMNALRVDGEYYALPIGGGCLGLFINAAHLKESGYDADAFPADWKSTVAMAQKLTRRQGDRITRTGFACGGTASQSWNYLVEGLFRQNGCAVISPDKKSIDWDQPAGIEAFTWYTDFARRHGVFHKSFTGKPSNIFMEGRASMIVDLNVVTAKIAANAPDLEYSVHPLPAGKAKATYGSCWGNSLTRTCAPENTDAALKFIHFLGSQSSARKWTELVGELPLYKAILQDPAFRERHKALLPFIKSMEYAHSSLKKDEGLYKSAIIEAIEKVTHKGMPPGAALREAALKVNTMLGER